MSPNATLAVPCQLSLALSVVLCACSGSDTNTVPPGSGTEVGGGGSSNIGSAAGGAGAASCGSGTASSTTSSGGSKPGESTGGGAGTGGSPTGGKSSTPSSATGGNAIGGQPSTGGRASTGSAATGGRSNGTGGQPTTGGLGTVVNTGGKSFSGGAASGGAASGGAASGGRATGGAASGGAATGGAATGGVNNGGCTSVGFHVQNAKIYDNHCSEFVMRGINYPYAWYTTSTDTRFADMASTKANSTRVVLSVSRWGTTTASNMSTIISLAKSNKMVAILEVHDCTGYGDDAAALTPDTCVAYWLKSDIVNVLKGNEAYVMINIANEAFGNDASSQWQSFYETNVPKFRSAGLKHTLIVDAPNWGQDWSNTMRDGAGATAIFNADPEKNVVFSTHMYDVYSSSSTVTSYFSKFLAKGVPFLIGEFAADHGSKGNVDEATIMSQCQQLGIGYLGWSWSGNSSDLVSLDITNNFNVSSLSTWGSTLIDGTNGIKATAKTCTCFQ